MPTDTLERLLDRLEELKRNSGALDQSRMERVLVQLSRRHFADAVSLIRFHEILLFMRAYPQSAALLRRTEEILSSFKRRVDRLREAGASLDEFTEPDVSGIAGTSFSALFTYDIVHHLARSHPSQIDIDWEDYDGQESFGKVLSRFLPLLEEDAYVETYFPYLAWLRAARGRRESDLAWLVERFERLPLPGNEKADLFDSLKLWLHWELGNSPATRTRLRRPVRQIFYHDGPLLRRSDVSLVRELESPPLPSKKLSPADGERLLLMGRDTMAMRYRELHGYTYGDARHVWKAEAGRGVEIFVWGVPPARRFPLLAYHAAFIFKNGVPVGYAEGLSLFERVEVGLNLFYTFRDGESAWIYARLLRFFRQFLGLTTFSVDPYQLGHTNEEGIESGAFWFYRKLGFYPTRPELMKLMLAEERKIAARNGYRSPAPVLRKLASGHVLFEIQPCSRSQWANFHLRNIGLSVQRRMAERFAGDAQKIRHASNASVATALGISTSQWKETERRAFENLALVLALIPDLAHWSRDEKRDVIQIVQAKAGADETRYLRLLQRHRRLRREIIKIGSEG